MIMRRSPKMYDMIKQQQLMTMIMTMILYDTRKYDTYNMIYYNTIR